MSFRVKSIFVYLCFLLLFINSKGYCQNTTPHKFHSKEKVGAIAFNANIDDSTFYLCDDMNIMEYYQVNPKYGEGAKSIRQYFKHYLNDINNLIDFDSGLITIRFIINCKGKTDRFRIYSVNQDYKTIHIPDNLKLSCIKAVKNMGEWQPGYYENEYFDCYYTLSLKIRNEEVVDVLP